MFSNSFPFQKSVTQLEILKTIFCCNTGNRIVALIPSPIGFDRLRNMLQEVLLILAKNAEIMVLLFTLNLVRNPQKLCKNKKMANTFALFPSRDNFKNSKKYTYTISTRTPSWVTELVKHMR